MACEPHWRTRSSPFTRGTQNDDWGTNANAAAIAAATATVNAFPLPDSGKDSAVLLTLSAGLYSAVATGANGSTGTGLVEFYVVP
jgi:hypothetical protein